MDTLNLVRDPLEIDTAKEKVIPLKSTIAGIHEIFRKNEQRAARSNHVK